MRLSRLQPLPLAAAGYRAARDKHHYRVIQSLEFTTAPSAKLIATFDGFRKKRNVSSYDVAGAVSDKEADEMLKLATGLRADVEGWIRATRPELFKPKVERRGVPSQRQPYRPHPLLLRSIELDLHISLIWRRLWIGNKRKKSRQRPMIRN